VTGGIGTSFSYDRYLTICFRARTAWHRSEPSKLPGAELRTILSKRYGALAHTQPVPDLIRVESESDFYRTCHLNFPFPYRSESHDPVNKNQGRQKPSGSGRPSPKVVRQQNPVS